MKRTFIKYGITKRELLSLNGKVLWWCRYERFNRLRSWACLQFLCHLWKIWKKKQFYPDQNLQFLFLHILFECRHPLHIYCRTILFLHKYLVRIMGQLIWYYFKLLSAQVLDPWPQKNLLEVKKKTDELAQHYLQIPRDFVPRSISKINDLTIARYWKIVLKCLYNPSSLF